MRRGQDVDRITRAARFQKVGLEQFVKAMEAKDTAFASVPTVSVPAMKISKEET